MNLRNVKVALALLAVSFIGFTGCKKEDPKEEQTVGKNYFPMAMGNEWLYHNRETTFYDDEADNLHEVILDDFQWEGNTYWGVRRKFGYGEGGDEYDTLYFRREGSKIFRRISNSAESPEYIDVLILDEEGIEDEAWSQRFKYKEGGEEEIIYHSSVYLRWDEEEVNGVVYKDVIEQYVRASYLSGDFAYKLFNVYIYYAKDVGIISFEHKFNDAPPVPKEHEAAYNEAKKRFEKEFSYRLKLKEYKLN